jgi:hypothetical protein
MYFNAWGLSGRSKKVSCIHVADKMYVTDGRKYFSFKNDRSNQNECHTKVITAQFSAQLWRPSTEYISATYSNNFAST